MITLRRAVLATVLLSSAATAEPPTDGHVDPNFGVGGLASASFDLSASAADTAAGLAVSSSGRIYMAATISVTSQGATRERFGLARFLMNGQLDTAFSGDGLASPLPAALTGQDLSARSIYVRADGKPVVVGLRSSSPIRILACRYNVAGNLDASFDGDGCAEPTLAILENGSELALTALAMPDDRVLIGGFAAVDPGDPLVSEGLVLMLNADGSIAQNFGSNGYVLVHPPGTSRASIIDFVRLGDGRLLAFGSSPQGMYVVRLSASGVLDTSFGANGYAQIGFGDLHSLPLPLDRARAGAVDSQGRIYMCGHIQYDNLTHHTVIAIARLTPDGILDLSYTDDGRILRPLVDVLPESTVANCEIDARDRLVLGLHAGTETPLNADFAALRLLSDGTPDQTFRGIGQTRIPIDLGGAGVGNDPVAGMALVGDDVLIGGMSYPTNGTSNTGETLTMIRLSTDRPFANGFED